MGQGLESDLEKILATLSVRFAGEGKARQVAILAESRPTIFQSHYDNWDGGVYGFTIDLVLPEFLYQQLGGKNEIELLEKDFEHCTDISRLYGSQQIERFKILTELNDDPDWRQKAKAYATGQGISNQGRARSDNVAPKMSDGLLFCSQPEIHLYRAFKALGVTFAPLPVFIRGGETYRRIEPDFLVLKDGLVLQVEVDGDTVHRETPLEAHNRTTMMAHEGVHVERVNASECDTEDKAHACAQPRPARIAR